MRPRAQSQGKLPIPRPACVILKRPATKKAKAAARGDTSDETSTMWWQAKESKCGRHWQRCSSSKILAKPYAVMNLTYMSIGSCKAGQKARGNYNVLSVNLTLK